jgi:cholest-4-en-3-one 26-monooxygenase
VQLSDVDLASLDTFVGAVPHDMFDLLRRDAPAFWQPETDGSGFWCLTRHEDVTVVNRDWETFSSARGGPLLVEMDEETLALQSSMMLNMDPPMHTRYRLLVNKGFTPRMISRLEERARALAGAIIDAVCEKGECDFVTDIAAELPLQVIAEMMGVPVEERHLLFDWSNRMIGSQDLEYAVSEQEVMDASTQLYAYADQLAAKKRVHPDEDIISVLISSTVDGEMLTDLEFDLFFLLLTVAGNETTRNLISHGMHALIEHPDQRARLLADPSLMPTAVDEMLRWASPVMHFRRTAQRDTQLAGQKIAEGDKVVIWYISANRDERVFERSHTFDIGRAPNDHIAFGAGGPHFCLGANLARLEIRIMFEELVKRMPDMELNGRVERLRSNFINGLKHMPVTFTPSAKAAS